ncbi:GTPase [Reticulomyxa filosa]|uniref:GTPase n=1 Tax=Reticulomyxa filosa TaxID=46433 RepID=X6MT60_RETFI|nr:GTPase [Reticulomyxa filosa]|eukprot:ETO17014.1 GTPase [Reticulomyxa filosa]
MSWKGQPDFNLLISASNPALASGWQFSDKHKRSLFQVLSEWNLQDLQHIFTSLLSVDVDFPVYYRFTCPEFCDIDDNGQVRTPFNVCPQWLEFAFSLHLFCKKKTKSEFAIVVLFGLGGSGKSCLAFRWLIGQYQQWDPTIEDAYIKKVAIDETHSYSVEILDTVNDEPCFGTRPIYGFGDVAIIVVDVTNTSRVRRGIVPFLEKVEHVPNRPFFLVGTKIDTRIGLPSENKEFDEIIAFCKQRNVSYIETSAKENINIDFLFQYIIYKIWLNSCFR